MSNVWKKSSRNECMDQDKTEEYSTASTKQPGGNITADGVGNRTSGSAASGDITGSQVLGGAGTGR